MFNVYSQFLRDYGMQGLRTSFDYIWFLVFMWVIVIAIKKVIRFPNKLSRKLFKFSVVVLFLSTIFLIIGERHNIGLLFKNIKDDKEFVSVLNTTLQRDYPADFGCKKYTISRIEEKIKVRGSKEVILNDYYYKITPATVKNIKDAISFYKLTGYAGVSDYVHQIRLGEYDEYRLKIEEELVKEKKAEEKAKADKLKKEAEAKKKEEEAAKKKAEAKKKEEAEGSKVDSKVEANESVKEKDVKKEDVTEEGVPKEDVDGSKKDVTDEQSNVYVDDAKVDSKTDEGVVDAHRLIQGPHFDLSLE